jgi:hypothetical protein
MILPLSYLYIPLIRGIDFYNHEYVSKYLHHNINEGVNWLKKDILQFR